MKRAIMILFILILFGLFSVSVAEETIEEGTMVVSGVVEEDIDNDLLFNMYAESLFGYSAPSFYRANHDFSEDMQEFYDFLVTCIKEVAAGERTSTEFTIEKEFTLTQEELDILMSAVVTDHPLEMYWYDKTKGTLVSFDGYLTEFSLSVSAEYSNGKYAVNSEHVAMVQKAAENAQDIVAKYSSLTDREKLEGYKNEICSLVSYNTDAANLSNQEYGNAYQLVWVFDGDETTNVVCEGYSKAFQYLCDMTDFVSDVYCITVTGVMDGGTGSGAHMWNIVTMESVNYHVDVTNCDENTIGYPDKLFLSGFSMTYEDRCDKFAAIFNRNVITYEYDKETVDLFGREQLTLEFGMNQRISWTFSEEGVLTFDGVGSLGDYYLGEGTFVNGRPWDAAVNKINSPVKKIVIGEGITGVGSACFHEYQELEDIQFANSVEKIEEWSFTNCVKIKRIVCPAALNMIGEAAFAGCSNLDELIFNEGLVYIGDYSFQQTPLLTKIDIPGTVKYVGYNAFVFNNFVEIQLREGIEIIRDGAFCGAKVSELILPTSLIEIGTSAFASLYNLTSVSIPGSVRMLCDQAFYNCQNLVDITLHEGIESIGYGAFEDCGMTSVFIPASVTYLSGYAFNHIRGDEVTVIIHDDNKSYTKQIVCVDCGEVIKEETIQKLGHDIGAWTEVRKATCTENGEDQAVCARCGENCIQVVDKLGHDNGEWKMIKAATCTEKGEESNVCNRCGESEHREIPAFGHDFGAWIEESVASCTVEGKKYRVCNRCNEREEYTGFAPGHHEVWKVIIPATREKEGLKQKICKRCNEILEEKIIPELAYTNKTASTIGLRVDRVAVPIDSNDAWKMLTPIDLTIQGTIRYPLIAGNVYEIGYVEVTIDDKMMNVELVIESDVGMDTTALVFLTDTEEFKRFSINDYEFYEFPAVIKLSDMPCDKLLMMVIGNLTIDPARPEPKYYNPKSAENKALLENLNEIYKQYFEEKK